MVRYLFYTIGDLTYQSPLIQDFMLSANNIHTEVCTFCKAHILITIVPTVIMVFTDQTACQQIHVSAILSHTTANREVEPCYSDWARKG